MALKTRASVSTDKQESFQALVELSGRERDKGALDTGPEGGDSSWIGQQKQTVGLDRIGVHAENH